MAKRKRLTPARLDGATPAEVPGAELPEDSVAGVKSIFPRYPEGLAPVPATRAPIASVAGDSAQMAAFEEVAQSLASARAEGRLIQRLPLDAIDEGYLVRDRVLIEDDEMRALCDSLRARGQQTAIEVTDLGNGRWGLVSGWRRLTALKRLRAEKGGTETVLAIVRRPADAADAYLAMVEENEIRVGLSYYERARIVLRAVEKQVYATERQALAGLFRAGSRAKRSKIGSFVGIVRALDAHLRFPASLSERAGLALAAALERDGGLQHRLVAALSQALPRTPEDEARQIAQAIAAKAPERPEAAAPPVPASVVAPSPLPQTAAAQVNWIVHADGSLTLRGAALSDPAFRERLLGWLRAQANPVSAG